MHVCGCAKGLATAKGTSVSGIWNDACYVVTPLSGASRFNACYTGADLNTRDFIKLCKVQALLLYGWQEKFV